MAKNENAVVEAQNHLPVELGAFEQDAGSGFENAGKESYAIPFISVLQALSPQCKKSEGAYIKGAEEGDLFNTVTNELIKGEDGVYIVPFYFENVFNEFGLREKGGGYFGPHKPDTPLRGQTSKDEKGRDILPNGHQLVDCRVHYVLVVDKNFEYYYPAVLSLSSTQIGKSKKWMSLMNGFKMRGKNGLFTPPMSAHVFHMTTVPESNEKGSWYGVKIEALADEGSPTKAKITPAHIYAAAQGLLKSVKSGEVKAAPPVDENAAGGETYEDAPF